MQVGPCSSTDTWGRLYPTSGTTAALVRGSFADASLGTLGTAHRAAGAAALLAGGTSAGLAGAGASTAAGAASGAGAVRVHLEEKRGLRSRASGKADPLVRWEASVFKVHLFIACLSYPKAKFNS